ESQSQGDREVDRAVIRNRQSARVAETDRTDEGVVGLPEPVRAATEHLRFGQQLDVDFQADDGLVGLARHAARVYRSGISSAVAPCSRRTLGAVTLPEPAVGAADSSRPCALWETGAHGCRLIFAGRGLAADRAGALAAIAPEAPEVAWLRQIHS